jgi:hypothetical protein
MRKCPPGVMCVENITMFFVFLCLILVLYLISYLRTPVSVSNNNFIPPNLPPSPPPGFFNEDDVLLNPYTPPVSDERYITGPLSFRSRGRIPINISTNVGAVDTTYRQVGILNTKEKGKILALMGRPLFVNRDKWQYYTMSDQNNSVKLPISRNGRSCTNEYGCDKLYSGDHVYVEGYNEGFRVTIYDNNILNYLPFI